MKSRQDARWRLASPALTGRWMRRSPSRFAGNHLSSCRRPGRQQAAANIAAVRHFFRASLRTGLNCVRCAQIYVELVNGIFNGCSAFRTSRLLQSVRDRRQHFENPLVLFRGGVCGVIDDGAAARVVSGKTAIKRVAERAGQAMLKETAKQLI